jgi:hypothetical protein
MAGNIVTDRIQTDTSYASSLAIETNGAERLRIDSSGNLGLGTSSPSTKLSVSSSGPNGVDLAVDQANSVASARLFFSNGTAGQAHSISNDTGALKFNRAATVGSSTGTESMRIDSSGNVGIGTTSPGAKLAITAAGDGTFNSQLIVAPVSGANPAKITFNPTISSAIAGLSDGSVAFFGNGANTERMRIDSTGNLLLGTNSANTAPTGYISAANTFGFKNRIINGTFEVWQRGTTSRVFALSGTYSADRWTRMGYQDGGHERVSVSSAVAGMTARYAIRATSATTVEAASGSRVDLSQKIESYNCYDLAGQTVTVSFWIRFSSATATSSTATPFSNWNTYLQYNTTTTDSLASTDTGDGGIGTYAITNGSLPTTWTKVTSTSTIPAGAKNISLRMQFVGTGNTAVAGTVWYEVTEITLEKGSVASSFDYRPYGTELALCQRYYEIGSFVSMTSIGNPYATVPFKVTKRAAAASTTVTNSRSLTLAIINDAASSGYATAIYQNSNDSAATITYFTASTEL